MRVLVAVGGKVAQRVADSVPEVEVVPVPPAVPGDVLLIDPLSADRLPELLDCGVGWVHVFGTGVDGVRVELLRERDVLVTCSRGASAVPIAEFVLAAMLAFEKDMPAVWVGEPPETWGWHRLGGLRGRTLGLVGLGGIGAEVARLALAFGMRVLAVRRRAAPPAVSGVEVVASLDEIGRAHV
jgi:phosphoglycerate dehydrogenase-like enzyme